MIEIIFKNGKIVKFDKLPYTNPEEVKNDKYNFRGLCNINVRYEYSIELLKPVSEIKLHGSYRYNIFFNKKVTDTSINDINVKGRASLTILNNSIIDNLVISGVVSLYESHNTKGDIIKSYNHIQINKLLVNKSEEEYENGTINESNIYVQKIGHIINNDKLSFKSEEEISWDSILGDYSSNKEYKLSKEGKILYDYNDYEDILSELRYEDDLSWSNEKYSYKYSNPIIIRLNSCKKILNNLSKLNDDKINENKLIYDDIFKKYNIEFRYYKFILYKSNKYSNGIYEEFNTY